MRLLLALKAFWKALKNPHLAKEWLEGKKKPSDNSHLRLLYLLQKSGRLVDFLKEDISSFSDAQVGGAVRKIHSECGRTLEELLHIRPLLSENEGSIVTIPAGYNAEEIKVVGKVKGQAPYQGILRHKGWKASKIHLPIELGDSESIVCPAEVEVKG